MTVKIESLSAPQVKPPALASGLAAGGRSGSAHISKKRGHRAHFFKLAFACLVASGVGAACVISADGAFQISAHEFASAPQPALRPVGYGLVASRANEAQAQSAKQRQSLYLVRSTLLALDQANRTGNYSVLRALGTPLFRSRNSSADLAVIFSGLRRNKIDLAEAALVNPNWQHPSRAKTEGLQLRGVIAMASNDVYFDMTFQSISGKWNIFALAVSAKPVPGGASRG